MVTDSRVMYFHENVGHSDVLYILKKRKRGRDA